MLLVDKQRPTSLEAMDFHKDISQNLMKMVNVHIDGNDCRLVQKTFHTFYSMAHRDQGRKHELWRCYEQCLELELKKLLSRFDIMYS